MRSNAKAKSITKKKRKRKLKNTLKSGNTLKFHFEKNAPSETEFSTGSTSSLSTSVDSVSFTPV
jgi:hypothetical protein